MHAYIAVHALHAITQQNNLQLPKKTQLTSSPPPHTHRSKLAEQHHARGYAARKQGRFDVAVEEYSKALALEPRHFKALFNRGFSYDKVCVHCVP